MVPKQALDLTGPKSPWDLLGLLNVELALIRST